MTPHTLGISPPSTRRLERSALETPRFGIGATTPEEVLVSIYGTPCWLHGDDMTPETFEPDTLEEPGGLADPLDGPHGTMQYYRLPDDAKRFARETGGSR
jgi:hypothetical protein